MTNPDFFAFKIINIEEIDYIEDCQRESDRKYLEALLIYRSVEADRSVRIRTSVPRHIEGRIGRNVPK